MTSALQLQHKLLFSILLADFLSNGHMFSTINVNGQMSKCKELLKCGINGLQLVSARKESGQLQHQTKQLSFRSRFKLQTYMT
jgi:hypothetical protein